MKKKQWDWGKRRNNYPRERWGQFLEYQNLIYNDKIFNAHKRWNHTDICKVYIYPACVIACKITGEKIISDFERANL